MKWLIGLICVLAFAAETQADAYYLDQYGNVIGVQRSAPSQSTRPNKRLRYVQSCPDGQCGKGFSGQSPMGDAPTQDFGQPDNQDITSYRPKQQQQRRYIPRSFR